MATFTGLAAGRHRVLARAGWDVEKQGLIGAPDIAVVLGAEAHATVFASLQMVGLGNERVHRVEADEQGRMRPGRLREVLAGLRDRPVIVSAQSGNVNTGAFDPLPEIVAAVRELPNAWLHVDGAFGLWAAVSPRWAEEMRGLEQADSWATDAHKTLNVPYDCGLAIVRDADALASSMAMHGDYLIQASGDPQERTPELSRRGRGFATWAALRSLGRSGVVDLVERLASRARAFAEGAASIPGCEVINDVVFTQVCLAFGDDDRTQAVTTALLADGTTWMSGSRWHDRAILRISVSNWSTTEDDVRRSLDALRRAAASV
jgi:glutamate/tyrosine decarboxylase-like PLP-dependent enzyme